MATLTLGLLPTNGRTGFWPTLYRREPLFAAVAAFMLILMVPTGLAWFFDARTFQGVNVWEKPLKFEFSIFLYVATLAFFAKWLPAGTREKRWYRIYAAAVAGGLIVEMVWIGFAASQGVASHFNRSNLAWTIAFPIMGAIAVMFVLAAPVYGYQIRRNARTGLSPAIRTAIVDGLVLTGVMTILAASFLIANDSHFVGGNVSDAEGAPVVGWARDGGDLRVAHFFATHAMQAIPLFALLSSRFLGGDHVMPVRLFTLAYAALTVFTLAQAAMGQPFLAFVR